MVGAGAPLAISVAEKLEAALRCEFIQGHGLARPRRCRQCVALFAYREGDEALEPWWQLSSWPVPVVCTVPDIDPKRSFRMHSAISKPGKPKAAALEQGRVITPIAVLRSSR